MAKGEAGGEYRFYRLMVDALALLDEKTIADGVIVRAVVRRTTRRSVKPSNGMELTKPGGPRGFGAILS